MKIVCQSCGKKYDTEKDELCPKCGSYNPFDGRASTQSQENKEEKQSRNCDDDSSWEKRERMKEELIRIAEEAKKKSEDSDLHQTEDSFSKQNQPMPEKKKSGSCLGFLFRWMVLICIVLTAVTWLSRGAAEITYRALKQEFQKMEQETAELNNSFWLDDGSEFVVKGCSRNSLPKEVVQQAQQGYEVPLEGMELLEVRLEVDLGKRAKDVDFYLRGEDMIYLPCQNWELNQWLNEQSGVDMWDGYSEQEGEIFVAFLIPETAENQPEEPLTFCVQQNKRLEWLYLEQTEKTVAVKLPETEEA